MNGWRRWLRLLSTLVLLVVLYFVVPVTSRADENAVTRIVTSLVVLVLLAGIVLWQVVVQLDHPDRRIDGLLLALLVAVLGFALGFYTLELHDSSQFAELDTRLDALYFTVASLLTVGFGDVHAVGQMARALVLVQMIFNVAVLAVAVTTLNSRVRERAAERAEIRRKAIDEGVSPRRAVKAAEEAHQARRTHRKPT